MFLQRNSGEATQALRMSGMDARPLYIENRLRARNEIRAKPEKEKARIESKVKGLGRPAYLGDLSLAFGDGAENRRSPNVAMRKSLTEGLR